MKRFISVICLIFLFVGGILAQDSLSNNASVSVLVCSPGNDLYAKFGHAGIRVCDEENSIDVVFDYGVFSMANMSKFIADFLTGETYYSVGVWNTDKFIRSYKREKRGIEEITLNLSPEQKQNLWSLLLENIQPENCKYLYNFFEDNCATRVITNIETVAPQIKWNPPYEEKQWREILLDYVGEYSIASWGIHVALGAPLEKMASQIQMLFLPQNVALACKAARLGNGEPLAKSSQQIIEPQPFVKTLGDSSALIAAIIIAIFSLALSLWECFTNRKYFIIDAIVFFVLGIVGCVLWQISFNSIHSFVFFNANIIWLSPLYLITSIFLLIKPFRRCAQFTYGFIPIPITAYFICTYCVQQYVPTVSYILLFAIIIRAVSGLLRCRK